MQVASCDARPRTREESNPRPAGAGSRRANHETTPEDQFEQQKSQKTSGFCTSTTPIPAEGRAGTLDIAKNHGFLHLDHADPRRGSRGNFRNRKNHGCFTPRPRRSPQRVARAPQKSHKTSSFCTSTTPIPAEGRASMLEIAKKTTGFCTSTTPIPAEGRAGTLEIAKNHGFLHLNHADPRRGSRGNFRNRKKNHRFLNLDHADPRRGSIFV